MFTTSARLARVSIDILPNLQGGFQGFQVTSTSHGSSYSALTASDPPAIGMGK